MIFSMFCTLRVSCRDVKMVKKIFGILPTNYTLIFQLLIISFLRSSFVEILVFTEGGIQKTPQLIFTASLLCASHRVETFFE